MEWTEKYGKIYGSYLGLTPEIVVGDLDVLKDILVKDFHNFTNRRVSIYMKYGAPSIPLAFLT